MTTALSTRLYNISIKTILKNYLDREFWKKQWTVYEYDGLTIKLALKDIDVRANSVGLRVVREGQLWGSTFSFNIDNNNEIVFTKRLLSAIEDQIRQHEYDIITDSEGFRQAVELDNSVDELNTLKAEKILDDDGVKNSDIRDSFVGSYVSENQSSHAREYRDYYAMRITPHLYLMLAYLYRPHVQETADALITSVEKRGSGKSMEAYVREIQDALSKIEVMDMEDGDE